MRVYVASWYENAEAVRDVHATLAEHGIEATSGWAYKVSGVENHSSRPPEAWRADAEANDADVARSDAILAIATPGKGAEMFAEIARGQVLGQPVVWVGRRSLSSWRNGVTHVDDVAAAVAVLVAMSCKEVA